MWDKYFQSLREKDFHVFEISSKSNRDKNSFGHTLLARSNFLRELRGIINPLALFSLHNQLCEIKPDIIWIHNVNNYWSWSALVICKLRAKTFLTCHELSAISNLKLKKSNFNSNQREIWWKCNSFKFSPICSKVLHSDTLNLFSW